jgi:hypothetical protein
MRRKQKALAILIGSAMFTSAARFSYSYLRFTTVGSRIHRVKPGTPRQQVLDILGSPNFHDGPCGKIIPARRGCATEFVYSHPLAPLIPDYYIVAFSKEGRVIDAEHHSSP